MSTPVAEAARVAREWIAKNTEIDSSRAPAAVLGFMLWIEESDIDLNTLRAVSAVKDNWSSRLQRVRKPRRKGESYMRPATPEELRSYRIGRSQRRGVSARFWYAVPAEKLVESTARTMGEWLGREPSKEIVK